MVKIHEEYFFSPIYCEKSKGSIGEKSNEIFIGEKSKGILIGENRPINCQTWNIIIYYMIYIL